MRISSIVFENFKVLRKTTLPLEGCSLIVGPNGSGKSTALRALPLVGGTHASSFDQLVTASEIEPRTRVSIVVHWGPPDEGATSQRTWTGGTGGSSGHKGPQGRSWTGEDTNRLQSALNNFPILSLDPKAIARPVQLQQRMTLAPDGAQLAGVLDRLRDETPEDFEALNDELARWFPSFNRVLFETPGIGIRGFALRTREGHRIPAHSLSDGTLLAITILTLGYVRELNPIIGLEDPDRGIHPRLLRDIRDALFRLSYPEEHGISRKAVQVVTTTHSPYFLDMFKEHLDRVVLAHVADSSAYFERLSDRPDVEEILRGAELGEAWFSGVLGGVPPDK